MLFLLLFILYLPKHFHIPSTDFICVILSIANKLFYADNAIGGVEFLNVLSYKKSFSIRVKCIFKEDNK